MEQPNIFEKGNKLTYAGCIQIERLPWVEHAAFKGVYLKHVITGAETGGCFSCHLVKISPNCSIGSHQHAGKLETHEVLEGYGLCRLGDKDVRYEPGTVTLIPPDLNHSVTAEGEGIFLLAEFSPALL